MARFSSEVVKRMSASRANLVAPHPDQKDLLAQIQMLSGLQSPTSGPIYNTISTTPFSSRLKVPPLRITLHPITLHLLAVYHPQPKATQQHFPRERQHVGDCQDAPGL